MVLAVDWWIVVRVVRGIVRGIVDGFLWLLRRAVSCVYVCLRLLHEVNVLSDSGFSRDGLVVDRFTTTENEARVSNAQGGNSNNNESW